MAALQETGGDIEASKEYLRKKGLATAEKKMNRVAAEGLIAVKEDKSNKKVTMVQIACETDFVAKTEQFQIGVKGILDALHHNYDQNITGQACSDQDILKKLEEGVMLVESLDAQMSSQTIQDAIKYTIAKTQENVQLLKAFQTDWSDENGDALEFYIHQQTVKGSGIGKLGSLVHLTTEKK